MFGYTLMFAGLARIIDICFLATSSSTGSLDDESEHTLAPGVNDGDSRSKAKAARAFRHLPPFVRVPSTFISHFFSDG